MAKRNFSDSKFQKELESTIDQSNMSGNALTAVDIKLSLIDPNPDNDKIFYITEIPRLAKTIQEEGFYGAIELYMKEDGRYEISSGHRRVEAMRMLGRETIPAIISPMPDDITKRAKLIKSNINNREITVMQRARMIVFQRDTLRMKIAAQEGRTYVPGTPFRTNSGVQINSALAEIFGMGESSIEAHIAAVNLIPELQQMVDEETVSIYSMRTVTKEDEDVQKKIYDELSVMCDLIHDREGVRKTLTNAQVQEIVERYDSTRVSKMMRKAEKKKSADAESPVSYVTPGSLLDLPADTKKTDPEPPGEEEEIVIIQRPVVELDQSSSKVPVIAPHIAVAQRNIIEVEDEPIRHVYIDSTITNIAVQFDKLISQDYEIEDRSRVKKEIQRLKILLKKIEEHMSV